MGILLAPVTEGSLMEAVRDAASRSFAGDRGVEQADQAGSGGCRRLIGRHPRSHWPCAIVAGRRPAVGAIGSYE